MSAIPAGYKQTEVGVIPADWAVPNIESVLSEISMGPFGSDIKVSNFVSVGIPVLSGANVRSERLVDSFTNFVTPAKAKALKKAVARRGDIVVTHRGTLGQISYIPDDSAFDSYVISQSQFRARFNPNLVTPSWVTLYFLSVQGAAKLLEGKGHTGVPALAQATTKFRQLHIPLPPLPEQRAIAAALSDVDALLAKLDQFIAKKRDLKQAAMQQLLTGQTRLPGFSGAWEVQRLGDVLRFQVGFPFGSEFFNQEGDGVRLIKNRDLKADDQIFFFSGKFDDTFLVSNGDVLIGMDGDFLPCLWSKGKALLNQRVGRVVPSTSLSAVFSYYMLTEPLKEIEYATSATTVKHLSHGDVEGIECALPAIEEQTAIATVLSDMDAELAALEARRDKTRALKQGMMQELLTGRIRLV